MSTGELRIGGGGSDGLKLSASQDTDGNYNSGNTACIGIINISNLDISNGITELLRLSCPIIDGKKRALSVFNVRLSNLSNATQLTTKVTKDGRLLWDFTGSGPLNSQAQLSTINNNMDVTRWRVEDELIIEANQSDVTDANLYVAYQILEG